MSRYPQYNVNNEHQLIKRENTYVLGEKLVSIHTEDRDISQWPCSNNFEIRLPEAITNVVGLKLMEIEIPQNQYTFSNDQQNIKLQFYLTPNNSINIPRDLALRVQSPTPYEITIQDGNYTPSQMSTEIENLMNRSVQNILHTAGVVGITYDNFKVYYDTVGKKMYFGNSYDNFTFKFTEQILYNVPCTAILNSNQPANVWNQYANWGLPSYLGFNKQLYLTSDISNSYIFNYNSYEWLIPDTSILPPNTEPHAYYLTSPNTSAIYGDTCIYMEVDKYNTIDELKPYPMATTHTYNNDYNGIVNSAFAKIPLFVNSASQVYENTKYGYLLNNNNYDPPIDKIRKLKIKFRYHDGRLVDFKQNNFNFSIMFYYFKDEIARDYVLRVPEQFKMG
jgi:hypothetical protein